MNQRAHTPLRTCGAPAGKDIAATSGTEGQSRDPRFVALSTNLTQLDLLTIQIGGMHISNALPLPTTIGVDGAGPSTHAAYMPK
jgi:hypothetical protein